MFVRSLSGNLPRDKQTKTKCITLHGGGNCANSRDALQFSRGNGELHAATQMTPCLTPCKKNARPVLYNWAGALHLRQGLSCRGGMSEATRIYILFCFGCRLSRCHRKHSTKQTIHLRMEPDKNRPSIKRVRFLICGELHPLMRFSPNPKADPH